MGNRFDMTQSPKKNMPVGQLALREMLALKLPPSPVESYVVQGARRTQERDGQITEHYPPQYAVAENPIEHLRFALKHEPLDLRVIVAALETIGERPLEDWVRSEPTGAFARRAWFFFETFTERTLDLEPVKRGNYVAALDEKRHFVARLMQRSSRHRVLDNLIGGPNLCVIVRRTAKLEAMNNAHLDREARLLTEHYDPETLARAVSFMYTNETRSSFAIEGETPSADRTERFVIALRRAGDLNTQNKTELIELQGSIVDPRYAASDWRDFQVFVSETTRRWGQNLHFICPRPEDVPGLMDGWMTLTRRTMWIGDPVVAAALSAFAFVFIHPFEDGNGRIHRFLVHHVLAKAKFSPNNVIFPVSAAILRDKQRYDQVLEAFSKPLFDFIDYNVNEDESIIVRNNTRDLYRFFDATAQAEYLYDRVAETIRVDLKEELDFLSVYDKALEGVLNIVDMPDRKASLLVRLCLQNGGRLSKNKRDQFSELTDEEITRLEATMQRAMGRT
jgi:Fic family protein